MRRYKVYRKDDATAFVVVKSSGFFPMEIKSRAIKASNNFTYADWTKLQIKRVDI